MSNREKATIINTEAIPLDTVPIVPKASKSPIATREAICVCAPKMRAMPQRKERMDNFHGKKLTSLPYLEYLDKIIILSLPKDQTPKEIIAIPNAALRNNGAKKPYVKSSGKGLNMCIL